MARIRTIKPEFFLHDELWECDIQTASRHGQEYRALTRLLFAGLWCLADREGRFCWHPRRIKAQVLPYDEVDAELILDGLRESGFVVAYTVNDKAYGYIPSFTSHQAINAREAKSRIPPPSEGTEMHVHAHARTEMHVHACGEGKGKEGSMEGKGKGKEGKGRERKDIGVASATPCVAAEQQHDVALPLLGGEDLANLPGDRISSMGGGFVTKAVDLVVEHYRTYHPRSTPGKKERALIAARLKEGRSPDTLRLAIDGNHKSPFHCGENERGKKYHRLDLIFRDASKTDEFVEIAEAPDEPVLTEKNRRTHRAAESYFKRRFGDELDEVSGSEDTSDA